MDTNRILMIVAAVVVVGALAWYFYPTLITSMTSTPAATTQPKK
jgi:hypothetical protein